MEKLSGLILDIYDDKEGTVLRELFSSPDDVPDIVKTAEVLDLDALPDNLFALVLHNDGAVLRKYACADSGNTLMSIGYFLKTAHKLPEEAQKVAANNLITACDWYGISPPEELSKLALGLGTALNAAFVLPSLLSESKQALKVVKSAGGNIVTPTQVKSVMGGG